MKSVLIDTVKNQKNMHVLYLKTNSKTITLVSRLHTCMGTREHSQI